MTHPYNYEKVPPPPLPYCIPPYINYYKGSLNENSPAIKGGGACSENNTL